MGVLQLGEIIMIICLIQAVFLLFKNRSLFKKLSLIQFVGVSFTYVTAVFIAFVCIYIGGNWIAEQISIKFLSVGVFIMIILVTMSSIRYLLSKILFKMTNGLFGS